MKKSIVLILLIGLILFTIASALVIGETKNINVVPFFLVGFILTVVFYHRFKKVSYAKN